MVGTFLWNFIKIRYVVSEKKMFKEKVNAQMDGRTTDNGPWHKLTGLWPVELTKKKNSVLQRWMSHGNIWMKNDIILPRTTQNLWWNTSFDQGSEYKY